MVVGLGGANKCASIPSYLRLVFYSDNQAKEATLFETRVHHGVNWNILISTKLL